MHKLTRFVDKNILHCCLHDVYCIKYRSVITGELSCIDSPRASLSFMCDSMCCMPDAVQNVKYLYLVFEISILTMIFAGI